MIHAFECKVCLPSPVPARGPDSSRLSFQASLQVDVQDEPDGQPRPPVVRPRLPPQHVPDPGQSFAASHKSRRRLTSVVLSSCSVHPDHQVRRCVSSLRAPTADLTSLPSRAVTTSSNISALAGNGVWWLASPFSPSPAWRPLTASPRSVRLASHRRPPRLHRCYGAMEGRATTSHAQLGEGIRWRPSRH